MVSQPPTPWAEPQPVMDDNVTSPYPVPPDAKDCGQRGEAAASRDNQKTTANPMSCGYQI
jgi:hypothetical protein